MSDGNRFSGSNRSGRSDFTVASAGALFFRRLVTINIGPLRGSIISAHQTTMNQRFALLLMPIVLVSSFTASGQSATQTSGSLDSRVRADGDIPARGTYPVAELAARRVGGQNGCRTQAAGERAEPEADRPRSRETAGRKTKGRSRCAEPTRSSAWPSPKCRRSWP